MFKSNQKKLKKIKKGQGIVEYAGAMVLATVVVAAGHFAINSQLGPGIESVITQVKDYLVVTINNAVP